MDPEDYEYECPDCFEDFDGEYCEECGFDVDEEEDDIEYED